MSNYILITGPNGFIGTSLVKQLIDKGFKVRACVRTGEAAQALSKHLNQTNNVEYKIVGDLTPRTNWAEALENVDTVVHLAARVHVLNDQSSDPLALYREMNTEVTKHLANSAIKANVKKFIFLSSIKVNGEQTALQPFTERDTITTNDPYGKSKWEAEMFLNSLHQASQLETIIIRPPLVYGKKVKANFQSLVKLVGKGLPVPLQSVKNKRSMIYVENLADAIITCINHPKAAGQTYLVSDNEVVSTAQLIRELAKALNKPARLWPFPPSLMRLAGKVLGKSAMVDRLLGDLVVDNSKIKRELNWQPPFTLQQALQRDFSS